MNPFLSFLLFVPFLVSLIFCLGALVVLFEEGPSIGMTIVFLIMAGLCGYLGYLFKKTLSSAEAILKVPDGENLTDWQKKRLTNLDLLATFIGLSICGLFLFDYYLMEGWFGFLAFCLGLFLIVSGIRMLCSNKLLSRSIDFQLARSSLPRNKLIIFIFTGGLGAIVIFSYKYLPSWQFISIWDISGVLFLLVSSCVWLVILERKRIADANELKLPH